MQVLPCPPAVRCSIVVKGDGRLLKVLLRGDANGRISVFTIPEVTDSQLEQIQQLDNKFENPISMNRSVILNKDITNLAITIWRNTSISIRLFQWNNLKTVSLILFTYPSCSYIGDLILIHMKNPKHLFDLLQLIENWLLS